MQSPSDKIGVLPRILSVCALILVGNGILLSYHAGAAYSVGVWCFNAGSILVLLFVIRRTIYALLRRTDLQMEQYQQQLAASRTKLEERKMLLSLHEFTETYLESEKLDSILRSLVRRVADFFRVDTVLIYAPAISPTAGRIVEGTPITNMDNICRKIEDWAASGKNTLVNDVASDPKYNVVSSREIYSFIVTPFIVRSRFLGFLAIFSKTHRDFTSDDLNNLTRFARHASLFIDSTRLIDLNKKLSVTDELTGLANKREFNRRIIREFQRSTRYEHFISLVTFDIDHLKNYNDTNGLPAGDKLLQQIGRMLARNTRSTDFPARVGDEEFTVILVETDEKQAADYAEKIRVQIERTAFENQEGQPGGNLTISAGIAIYPKDAGNVMDLIRKSDAALYRSKQDGRNRVTVYRPGLDDAPSHK